MNKVLIVEIALLGGIILGGLAFIDIVSMMREQPEQVIIIEQPYVDSEEFDKRMNYLAWKQQREWECSQRTSVGSLYYLQCISVTPEQIAESHRMWKEVEQKRLDGLGWNP